jgi:hypothetical protein
MHADAPQWSSRAPPAQSPAFESHLTNRSVEGTLRPVIGRHDAFPKRVVR